MWLKNKKINKTIAIGILAVIILQSLGIFGAVGYNLSTINLGPLNLFSLLLVVGSAWIAIGLYKMKIGV